MSPEAVDAVLLSLRVGVFSVAIGLPASFGIVWLCRVLPRPAAKALSILALLPLVLPPVVTGYVLLLMLGPNSVLGGSLKYLGVAIAFNWKGAVVASTVMAIPLMVRALQLAWETLPLGLTHVAATLGASPVEQFRTITWPLLRPGVITAAILGFAKSIGEFGATITLAANIPGQTQTIPSAIFDLMQIPGGEREILVLCLVSVAFALGALLASEWFARKGNGL
ncbi:MAG: molybdate ABC transporter permease subunit [Pseudomonadota bacterium]